MQLLDRKKRKRIEGYKKVIKYKIAHSMAVNLRKDKIKTDLIQFLHAALFSPVKSTLSNALNSNQLKTWPGLDKKLVSKHLSKV